MARVSRPLTDSTIKRITTPCTLWDGRGLHLIVSDTSKIWAIRYTLHGKTRKLNLGQYPTVSLAMARRLHEEALVLIHQGKPLGLQDGRVVGVSKQPVVMTFRRLAEEWFSGWCNSVTLPHSTRVMVQLNMIFPSLGNTPVDDLRAVDVLAALRPIEAQGHVETARRVNTVVGQVLQYGVATGRVKYDCRSRLATVLSTHRQEHFPCTLEISDIPQLLRDITLSTLRPDLQIACRLLMLTLVRPNELLGARWSEIDMDAKVWIIPAHRMKARKEHKVPLSTQALELFHQLSALTDSPWVFPSLLDPGQSLQPREANRALLRLGYQNRLTAHGIRSLMATLMVSKGHSIDVVDAALAHTQGKVRRAYFRHPDLTSRKAMFDDLGQTLASSASGALSGQRPSVSPVVFEGLHRP